MEKYDKCCGFVYMWCDMTKNKYYIGSHGGNQTHAVSYKCGNTIMKRVIKKRPETCLKRVLEYCYIADRNFLYDMEEKWLNFYDVKNNPNFYNHKNFAIGPINQKSSRKGKKMSELKPGWVNPNKGKTRKEIMGFELPSIIPPKPFILRIEKPHEESYEKIFKTQNECIKDLKISKSFLRWICVTKFKMIERVTKNIKHNFPIGTKFYFEYVNKSDDIPPDEYNIRKNILLNHKKTQKNRQIKNKGMNPVGRLPQEFEVTIYSQNSDVEYMKFNSHRDFKLRTGATGILGNFVKMGVVVLYPTINNKSIFKTGDVLVFNEKSINKKCFLINKKNHIPYILNITSPLGVMTHLLCFSHSDCVAKTGLSTDIIHLIRRNGEHTLNKVLPSSKHSYPKHTKFTIEFLTPLKLIEYYQKNG